MDRLPESGSKEAAIKNMAEVGRLLEEGVHFSNVNTAPATSLLGRMTANIRPVQNGTDTEYWFIGAVEAVGDVTPKTVLVVDQGAEVPTLGLYGGIVPADHLTDEALEDGSLWNYLEPTGANGIAQLLVDATSPPKRIGQENMAPNKQFL